MLTNYLRAAFRHLWRNKAYTAIHLLGLALGLALSMLILLFVTHEQSYDRFHTHADVIAKVGYEEMSEGEKFFIPWMSYQFGETMQQNCPEVKDFARIRFVEEKKRIRLPDNSRFFEDDVIFADAGFLRVFSFPLIKGNPKVSLARPGTVLITSRIARKYFKNADPIGKILVFEDGQPLEVTGIIAEAPSHSSIHYSLVLSLATYRATEQQIIRSRYTGKELTKELSRVGASGGYTTYLQLINPGAMTTVEKKIPTLISQPLTSAGQAYYLEPLTDIHLRSREILHHQLSLMYTLSAVAVLILLLAIINYSNLTTARYTVRAKEVAVRKLTGAFRQSLIYQFYIESAVYISLATILAFILFQSAQSFFLDILGVQIQASFLSSRYFWMPFVITFIGLLLLSGSYPAVFLSRFSPAQLLTGKYSAGKGSSSIRKGLTVFQFVISGSLIISSLLIYKQLNFILTKDAGLNRSHVVVMRLEEDMSRRYRAIRQEIEQLPGVASVTGSSLPLFQNELNSWDVQLPGTAQTASVNTFVVDESFVEVMKINWKIKPVKEDVAGGNYAFMNEVAAKKLGLNERNYRQELDFTEMKKTLAGVMKDFNYKSLRYPVQPMLFFVTHDTLPLNYLYVKLKPTANWTTQLTELETVYNQFKKEKPFDYYFLDVAFAQLYQSEMRLKNMIFILTSAAIVIACLGLLGLVAFTTQQRTKEIGIRKVLGASVLSIVALLSRDFLKLVLLAFVIAVPIAYYFMNQWLQSFAYRVKISWWVFALSGGLALLLAGITVSFQSIGAALANPVKSLRND